MVINKERIVPDEVELMYLIGEALIGEGNEVAHVDLLIGDKEGPVGTAFANGLTQLSMGHTPLLAVVRPNLIPKPATIIVPKVTVKGMAQTGRSSPAWPRSPRQLQMQSRKASCRRTSAKTLSS
jgi:hypothetical protein